MRRQTLFFPIKKSIRFTFIFGFFVFSLTAQQQQKGVEELKREKAEKVIERYLQALGGKEKLDEIHSLVIEGKGRSGGSAIDLPMTLYIKNPNKNKMEIAIMNQKMIMATDGDISWGLNPFIGNGQPRQFPVIKEEDKKKKNHVFFTLSKNLIDYKDRGFLARYIGKVNFRGKKVHRIQLVSDFSEDDYYIDAETYYLCMTKIGYSKSYFDDYKKVGDIVFPHKLENGGLNAFTIHVNQVMINMEIEDGVFAVPYTQFNIEEHIFLNEQIEDETFDFAEEDLSADIILKRFVREMGLDKEGGIHKFLKVYGKMTVGSVEIPFVLYDKKLEKFRMEMSIMNQKNVIASNGKIAWEIDPFEGIENAIVLEDVHEIERSRGMITFGRELLDYLENAQQMVCLGKTSVRGRKVHVVKLEDEQKGGILYFFDQENYQLLLKHSRQKGIQEYYSNYQLLNGTQIPYRIETYNKIDDLHITYDLEDFDFNLKFRDRLFNFPKN